MFNFVQNDSLNSFNLERVDTDNGRFYKAPNGNLYSSVTTVLSKMNKGKIVEWRRRVGEEEANRISKHASSRGTRIHKLCEDYILGKPQEKLNPFQKHLFEQIRPALDSSVNNVYCLENKLYSDKLRLAGTVDLISEYNGELTVIDFKTSSKLKREEYIQNYFFQTTCYSLMFQELTGLTAKQIAVIIAVEGESNPQIFVKRRKDYILPLLKFLEENHLNGN